MTYDENGHQERQTPVALSDTDRFISKGLAETEIVSAKARKNTKGPLKNVQQMNERYWAEINSMTWLEKMQYLNDIAYQQFLKSLLPDNQYVEMARQKEGEALLRFILNMNQQIDAKRLKDIIDDFDLKRQRTLINDLATIRRHDYWYTQALAQSYQALDVIINQQFLEIHFVLEEIIHASDFDDIPNDLQSAILSVDAMILDYINDDYAADFDILSDSSLQVDGKIDEIKLMRMKQAMEKIKARIARSEKIAVEIDAIAESIKSHNPLASEKLQKLKKSFDEKKAPIMNEIKKIEAMQHMPFEGEMVLKDLATRCLRTVDNLSKLKKTYASEISNDVFNKDLKNLEIALKDAASSLSGNHDLLDEKNAKLLSAFNRVNAFTERYSQKEQRTEFENNALNLAVQLKTNFAKIIAVDAPILSVNKSNEKNCMAENERVETPLADSRQGLADVNSALTPESKSALKQETASELSMGALCNALLADFEKIFSRKADEDITPIKNMLDNFKNREVNMALIEELEMELVEKLEDISDESLRKGLIKTWEKEKDNFIDDLGLEPTRHHMR